MNANAHLRTSRSTVLNLGRTNTGRLLTTLTLLLGGTGSLLAATRAVPTTTTNFKLFVNETCTSQVTSLFAATGATPSKVFHQNFIDANDDGNFDPAAMNAAIGQIPFLYTGPVALDWEGVGMDNLVLPNPPAVFEHAKAEFIKAIKHFKTLRPNAKVGFYGLPRTVPFDTGPAWLAAGMSLMPIFAESDCIFPSLYTPYAVAQPFFDLATDFQTVHNSITLSLMVAGSKPVYAYVSPRYHESNALYGGMLIPAAEFKARIAEIFRVTYNGRRAAGLVWWGDDRYYLWLSRQNLAPSHPQYLQSRQWKIVFAREWLRGETDNQHFTRIHTPTLYNLSSVLANAPR